MKEKETIWLIDDDELSNFLTSNIFKVNEFHAEVRSFTRAQEALAELETSVELKSVPDIIFLDLNMPVMDGWAFLEAFRLLPEIVRKSCTIYILSSSVNEEDINKSKLYEDVRDFFSKPLNKIDLDVVQFQLANYHHNSWVVSEIFSVIESGRVGYC